MNASLLLIPILIPIAAGGLLLVLPDRGEHRRNTIVEVTAVVTSVIVWILIATLPNETWTAYYFTQGFAINFRLDGMAKLFSGMIAIMWPVVLIYAFSYMKNEHRQRSFFGFYLMVYGVTLGVAFSADILTLYVFYEMLTLTTIPLVTHYQDHESMYAGRKYAAYVIGGASLSFIAVVLATIDGRTGSFMFGGNLGGQFSADLMRVVFLFGFFGFAVKAALVPMHGWLPSASVAPTPDTPLLHAVAVVNTGVFAVTRLTCYTFGTELIRGTYVQVICLITVSISLVYSAACALRERHFKRRLAYSTVSNLSYMLFGIMLLTPAGTQAGLAHMVFHGVTKLSLFLCAGAFLKRTGKEYLYDLGGAGKVMPWTLGFYTIAALSLTGLPMLCGFVSKWLLITGGIAEGSPAAIIGVIALIIASLLCAIYSLSVSVRAFFPSPSMDRFANETRMAEKEFGMMIPIAIFTAVIVILGIVPGPLLSFLEKIAGGVL